MKREWLILLVIVSFISLISFSSADFKYNNIPSTPPQNQSSNITLIQDCNCSFANVTFVVLGNGTIVNFNASMTRNVDSFNWTLNNTYTSSVGTYSVHGVGDDGGNVQPFAYNFDVNPTGSTLTTAQAIIYLIFLIGSLFVLCFFLYWSITLPFKNPRNESGFYLFVNDKKWMKICCMVMAYMTALLFFGLLYSVTSNYLNIGSISQFFFYFYTILISLLIPLIITTGIISIIVWIRDLKISRGLKQHLRMK